MIEVYHRIPRDDLGLGLVRVEGIAMGPAPLPLATELDRWIALRRSSPLSAEEEARRKGSRDMLRNGAYKPTGRGKPASEYLMRAAGEDSFPRINGPVDANNLVSLKHCVPISLWDLDLAGTGRFEFRLGRATESYVFNPTGQVLQLRDLVCGCCIPDDGGDASRPMVTPIKDSMATKLTADTTRLAGCIYYPLQAGNRQHLEQITTELFDWLLTCGKTTQGAVAVAQGGDRVTL